VEKGLFTRKIAQHKIVVRPKTIFFSFRANTPIFIPKVQRQQPGFGPARPGVHHLSLAAGKRVRREGLELRQGAPHLRRVLQAVGDQLLPDLSLPRFRVPQERPGRATDPSAPGESETRKDFSGAMPGKYVTTA
jgi:hypothetical protein